MTHNTRPTVIINIDNSDSLQSRMNFNGTSSPRWFGRGIADAGAKLIFKKNPLSDLVRGFFNKRLILLCFNPSIYTLFYFILPIAGKRISLFQWRPISRRGVLKGLAILLILRRSDKILVYDFISYRYIRYILKNKSVEILGLYTDTAYFKPSTGINREPIILVPGDHLRDEQWMVNFAQSMDIPIVRVTRSEKVASVVRKMQNPRIRLAYDISYDELRTLYQQCACVVIKSNATEIPTGITSLCEGLACGAFVIINRGHASAAFGSYKEHQPFIELSSSAKAEDYANVITHLINESSPTSHNESGVRRVRELCSAEVVTQQWIAIIDSLIEN